MRSGEDRECEDEVIEVGKLVDDDGIECDECRSVVAREMIDCSGKERADCLGQESERRRWGGEISVPIWRLLGWGRAGTAFWWLEFPGCLGSTSKYRNLESFLTLAKVGPHQSKTPPLLNPRSP